MATDDELVFQALPLTGDAGDAFTAIAALLEAAYLVGEEGPGFEEEAFALASRLVARARGAADAPTDAELRMAAVEHGEAAAAAVEGLEFALPESLEELSEELVQLTEELIREAALEEHTHDAYLALQGDTDTILLVVAPVTVAAAHVWLLGSLFERVEMGIMEEPAVAMERAASAWWFNRWRPESPTEEDEHAAVTREQEWSLVERPTLDSGLSFVQELVDDGEFLAALPPRQRHLARQLLQSVPGVWEVRERTGEEALFVSADGTEYRVREHGEEDEYGAGAVGIGRLIPFGDETWLRSPGMHFTPDPASLVAADDPDLAPSIMLESLITGIRVPRSVPPARSASEARKVLAASVLEGYEDDPVVSAWMAALAQMAKKGTGGSKSKKKRR
jgi:hypothetical protein